MSWYKYKAWNVLEDSQFSEIVTPALFMASLCANFENLFYA